MDNLEASSAMPVGLLTTVQTNMKPLSINQHEDNRPSVANQSIANSSFDSVLSTITGNIFFIELFCAKFLNFLLNLYVTHELIDGFPHIG